MIGNQQTFAIECYHEPIPNNAKRVFGRMCIWAKSTLLGDIEEPACMLSVTEEHFLDVINRLESLEDSALAKLADKSLFDFLNQALYIDDARTTEEVMVDAERYFKFDFLTNGGESFDRTKSFLISDGSNMRLLFTDCSEQFHSAHISKDEFVEVITSFLAWIKSEEQYAG